MHAPFAQGGTFPVKHWLVTLGIGLVLGIGLDVAWWVVVAHPLASARGGDEVVIPAGTAEALRVGAPFAFAPSRFTIPAGGRLRVINRDSVPHTVGSTVIPPGASADVEASASGELLCSIHPKGHLAITLGTSPPLSGMILLAMGACVSTLVAGWILRSSPAA